jgi:hypothetical protein
MDMIRDFMKAGGEKALMENVKSHAQISTGDAQFDIVATDIMDRMREGDKKVLTWNDNVSNLVGLYDQATLGTIIILSELTLGDLRKNRWCKEPVINPGLVVTLAFTRNYRGLIDKYRRSAHTKQFGKSRHQAIEEFKALSPKLYAANKEELPVPIILTPFGESESTSVVDMETKPQPHVFAGDPTAKAYGALTPGGNPTLLEASRAGKDNKEKPLSPNLIALENVAGAGPLNGNKAIAFIADGRLISDAKGSTHPGPVSDMTTTPENKAVFSKDWWTPGRSAAFAVGTAIGLSVVTGSALLFNKIFRRRREIKKERLHARAWKLSNDMEQVYASY